MCLSNHAHSAVSFTMEVEENGMLPFLGLQLLNRAPRVETKVYVKPTNTGLPLTPAVRFFRFVLFLLAFSHDIFFNVFNSSLTMLQLHNSLLYFLFFLIILLPYRIQNK